MERLNMLAVLPLELPRLPYRTNALVPYISKETLEHHYGKHHRAYVNKLNQLIKGTDFEHMALVDVIRTSQGQVFNNASQVWNHTFYWNCMRPRGGGSPSGELARAIDACFGSFNAFASAFKTSAAGKFGSGWTWLVKRPDGSLAIRNSDDADTPLRWGDTPLLTCDVWEHAYYIDYRNERGRYIEGFWQLANWEFASQNLAASRVPARTTCG